MLWTGTRSSGPSAALPHRKQPLGFRDSLEDALRIGPNQDGYARLYTLGPFRDPPQYQDGRAERGCRSPDITISAILSPAFPSP